jgi:hypothetical protein
MPEDIADIATHDPIRDWALLDLCRQFERDSRELTRNDALTWEDVAADPTLSLADDALVPLLDRWQDTMDQIIHIPARTATGIQAKARALGHALDQKVAVDINLRFEDQAKDYELLAMSLVRDLAGGEEPEIGFGT